MSSHGSRLVALAIADFCDDEGRAYPALGTLAKKAALSERATHSAIQDLKALGELRIEPNAGPRGVNVYFLTITPAEIAPPQKVQGAENGKKGVQILQEGVQKTTERGADSAPKPSGTVKEPSKNRHGAKSGFTEFWKAYPKRIGPGTAEVAWIENGCSNRLPEILGAIRAFKLSEQWTDEGGKFIPHPAKWLNRRGWEDEVGPKKNGRALEWIPATPSGPRPTPEQEAKIRSDAVKLAREFKVKNGRTG